MQYILGEKALTLMTDDGPVTLHAGDERWDKAIELLRDGNMDALLDLVNPAKKILSYMQLSDRVTIEEGELLFDGKPLPGDFYIVKRILAMADAKLPVRPLVSFLERLMDNPSRRAVAELPKFLEYGQLPLTEDGHFLAYKKVRWDYKDIYSGTMDNSVGKVVEVQRNMVDEDPDHTCSHGLHVCSFEYLQHYGSNDIGRSTRIVVCKINPKDVVAVPRDYNNTKMRVCRYEVTRELPNLGDTLGGTLVEDPGNAPGIIGWTVEHPDRAGMYLASEHEPIWVDDRSDAIVFPSEKYALEVAQDFGLDCSSSEIEPVYDRDDEGDAPTPIC